MRSDQILQFLSHLEIPITLPRGVRVMNPYREPTAWSLCQQFYHKFYGDNHERHLILGINPGRFGGGTTGIPFTDPIKLLNLGIANSMVRKTELSADFIYEMIAAFGGPGKFYKQFYISSISPLGFTKAGKNLNYYDVPLLEKRLRPFIIQCMQTQLGFGIRRDAVFCLGEGSNYKYLSKINDQFNFFEKVVPLSHPRFIMQYRRKKKDDFIKEYIRQLTFT